MKTELSKEAKSQSVRDCMDEYGREKGIPATGFYGHPTPEFVEWLCVMLSSFNFAKKHFNGEEPHPPAAIQQRPCGPEDIDY